MTNQHPITPPPELAQQWLLEAHSKDAPPGTCPNTRILILRAAQWGADRELEACCEWVSQWCGRWPDGTRPEDELRAARRTKPPSLKEQALIGLSRIEQTGEFFSDGMKDLDTIRRALEALPDD